MLGKLRGKIAQTISKIPLPLIWEEPVPRLISQVFLRLLTIN